MINRKLLAISMMTLAAFAADPMMGTWKLNAAKTKYTGAPAPKEMTATYTPMGEGWTYEAKGVAADGKPLGLSFMYMKDNEDIKMTGYPYADTLVLKKGKSTVSTGTFKREGKPVGTVKRTLSKDGKVMTIEARLTLADGKTISYISVYDKQ